MITGEQAASDRRVIVPVWLRVPGHADIAHVGTVDLIAELERRGFATFPVGVPVEVADLRVPPKGGTATWGEKEARLSRREADVLRALAAAWPRAVPVVRLAELVWGRTWAEPHARLYVRYLRRKFGPAAIVTEPGGGGYRLNLCEETGR